MIRKVFTFRTQSLLSNSVNGFSTKPKTRCIESLEQVHIDEAVKRSPVLSSASVDLWNQSHKIFSNHGIKTQNFLQIITGNPSLLSRQPKKIIESFENWRSCQFGEQSLYLLITKYPSLLDAIDGRKLVKHVTFLKGYVGTNKNVWKLLMNSPELIKQSEKTISQKIDYITNVMRIDIPEIAKSEALSKSMFEIKCRHVFLDRLGLFKPRPLKSNMDEPTKNNRLYQITDTSDNRFATKIAHVRLEEYEAFQELYKRESNKKDMDEMEEDNDEEDEVYDDDEGSIVK